MIKHQAWLLILLFCKLSAAVANSPVPKVQVSKVYAWTKGIQKPLYCRGDAPHRFRLASHALAELEWVVPVASTVKKGDLIAQQSEVYLQKQLGQLEADIAVQQADFQYAFAEFNRLASMGNQSLIAESELGQLKRDYTAASARVTSLQARRETIQYQLTKLEHRAPMDGSVLALLAEPGEWIGQGEDILLFLPEREREITCQISLEVFHSSNQFQQALFYLFDDADPSRDIPLTLLRKASFVDSQDQTFTAHFGLGSSRAETIMMGQRYTVLLRQPMKDLFLVPYDALTFIENQTYIWHIDPQNNVYKSQVKVIDTKQNFAVVSASSEISEQAIVRGKQQLSEGISVDVIGDLTSNSDYLNLLDSGAE